jgi:hypothetical protein
MARLPAAIVSKNPTLPVGIAASAEALIETLLTEETPPELASAALQDLVSVEPIRSARAAGPLPHPPWRYFLFLFGTQTPSVPPCFGNWQCWPAGHGQLINPPQRFPA